MCSTARRVATARVIPCRRVARMRSRSLRLIPASRQALSADPRADPLRPRWRLSSAHILPPVLDHGPDGEVDLQPANTP